MVKNIEILSGFVAKNGPQFEDMARQKQADDPKFGFLFGGEPGSEAAIGKTYYEWRKRCLIAAKDRDAASPVNEAPLSPDGSDMDMEGMWSYLLPLDTEPKISVILDQNISSQLLLLGNEAFTVLLGTYCCFSIEILFWGNLCSL